MEKSPNKVMRRVLDAFGGRVEDVASGTGYPFATVRWWLLVKGSIPGSLQAVTVAQKCAERGVHVTVAELAGVDPAAASPDPAGLNKAGATVTAGVKRQAGTSGDAAGASASVRKGGRRERNKYSKYTVRTVITGDLASNA